MDMVEKCATAFVIVVTICVLALTICAIWILKESNTNKYDVNGDGVVSAADYIAIKNYIMEK